MFPLGIFYAFSPNIFLNKQINITSYIASIIMGENVTSYGGPASPKKTVVNRKNLLTLISYAL